MTAKVGRVMPYDPVPSRGPPVTASQATTPDSDPTTTIVEEDPGVEESALVEVSVLPQAASRRRRRRGFMDRVDAFISRLSTRSNFWHRVCSMIWLPYAFKSGIRMKRIGANTFSAVLPFKRINRNWYNAMAGAALLANSEIAGGMFLFGFCGGDYTVVCKELTYRFLRPCYGPALYKITPREDVGALLQSRREFNATLDLDIVQQFSKKGNKERRVGKCTAVFHVTPKQHQQTKGRRIR